MRQVQETQKGFSVPDHGFSSATISGRAQYAQAMLEEQSAEHLSEPKDTLPTLEPSTPSTSAEVLEPKMGADSLGETRGKTPSQRSDPLKTFYEERSRMRSDTLAALGISYEEKNQTLSLKAAGYVGQNVFVSVGSKFGSEGTVIEAAVGIVDRPLSAEQQERQRKVISMNGHLHNELKLLERKVESLEGGKVSSEDKGRGFLRLAQDIENLTAFVGVTAGGGSALTEREMKGFTILLNASPVMRSLQKAYDEGLLKVEQRPDGLGFVSRLNQQLR